MFELENNNIKNVYFSYIIDDCVKKKYWHLDSQLKIHFGISFGTCRIKFGKMRVVALISGGKDSCFNMMQCIAAGHEIVALANLYPIGKGNIQVYLKLIT